MRLNKPLELFVTQLDANGRSQQTVARSLLAFEMLRDEGVAREPCRVAGSGKA